MTASDAVLLGAVAQGLVRFDSGGQIEPGLAIRWDVSDDGLYYTFRLGPDATLDAPAVARLLRAAAAPAGRNPLASELTAIVDIVAVTDEVIEIRLAAPRPRPAATAGPARAGADRRQGRRRAIPDPRARRPRLPADPAPARG